jgi:two-component system, NtrC family, sensor kinase
MMFTLRSSLKTRILLLIGSVVVLLMLLISSVLLLKWRELIIQKETENALSISRTFAVTVIDAMIFEEKSVVQKENILDTYVDNFVNSLKSVQYVALFDRNGASILQTVRGEGGLAERSADRDFPPQTDERVTIRRDPQFGWILEVNLPFIFSGKHWGTASIGFSAQPLRDEIQSVFYLLLFATILITSIVLIILFFFINRMTSSLEKLVREIDKIDFVSDVDISLPSQNDEIGFLYHHFRLMMDRLDVSKKELEQAQRQIYQAEKLASIGRLASGVAHQVNNPLNGIRTCLYAIQQNPGDQGQARQYLGLIDEGITNIETVVKKLLGFARQQSTSDHVISINDSITTVTNLFDLRLKEKNIETVLELAADAGSVRIDHHLFQEVVMNLLLNSYDAVGNGGVIQVATGNKDNSSVFMRIQDNGCGISQSDLKRIFDPFFTTKEIGTGTGLGLSVCMGIIESHGGTIVVQSTEGAGTSFTITLPRADADENSDH